MVRRMAVPPPAVVVITIKHLNLQHLIAAAEQAAAVAHLHQLTKAHLVAVQVQAVAVVLLLPNLVTQIHLKQVYLSQQQMPRQIRSSIVQEAQ